MVDRARDAEHVRCADPVGAAQIHKTVSREQRSVAVDLMREEIHVEQREVAERQAADADLQSAFREGTFRVPVRGEEAVAVTQPVTTGYLIVGKARSTDTREAGDAVLRNRANAKPEVQKGFERP